LRWSVFGQSKMGGELDLIPLCELLESLPRDERRGSRARCILLTHGSNEDVAHRLSALAAPFVIIDPNCHHWMPRGFAEPREAILGDAPLLLSAKNRRKITEWWLAVQGGGTPTWDIASTATINGTEGLLLVEAKAHFREMKLDGMAPSRHAANNDSRQRACREATSALNSVLPGWSLPTERHFQVSNRFAWAWKPRRSAFQWSLSILALCVLKRCKTRGSVLLTPKSGNVSYGSTHKALCRLRCGMIRFPSTVHRCTQSFARSNYHSMGTQMKLSEWPLRVMGSRQLSRGAWRDLLRYRTPARLPIAGQRQAVAGHRGSAGSLRRSRRPARARPMGQRKSRRLVVPDDGLVGARWRR
jgi:hypothetical protein